MAAARMAVKPGRRRRKDPTSESDPTVTPEPAVPKPKGKARKGRNAVAKAVAAAKAPITKRPAAATIAKRPAAAPAKLDKFNIDAWMEENASRVEARNEPRRHNFLSRVHHRAIKAGFKPGHAGNPAGACQRESCQDLGLGAQRRLNQPAFDLLPFRSNFPRSSSSIVATTSPFWRYFCTSRGANTSSSSWSSPSSSSSSSPSLQSSPSKP